MSLKNVPCMHINVRKYQTFYQQNPISNYEKAFPKHSCELQIYVTDFRHLMFETSSDIKALTHFIMTFVVMICLLTFPMEMISIWIIMEKQISCNFFTSKNIMELVGIGNETCNIYIKQINHKTNMEFE